MPNFCMVSCAFRIYLFYTYIHTYQYTYDRLAWSLNPLLHMHTRTRDNNSEGLGEE